MDPGRYVQQGWDANSALEGYGAVHEPDFRAAGSYGGRRYLDERDVYARNVFHRDMHERDVYPPPPPVPGIWSQPRRRGPSEEYASIREPRRHDKSYHDQYHEMDNFHEADKYQEIDSFHEVDRFNESYNYHDTNRYRDYGLERHSRFGGRDDNDLGDTYDYRNRISHRSRETSRERDHDFGRYSCDSDHERVRRDGSWRRRESRDRERDRRGVSRERDPSPYRRHDRSHSRGRDERSRSRSPRGRSRGRSHREDSNDDDRYEKSDKHRDWDRERDERRYPESSVAPSATIVVKGLSQKTNEEDLYQILSEWGPLRHIRVIKERNSGISRGFAFIDFPTVEAARNMMDGIGESGLSIDGRKLLFEYSKPTGGVGAPLGQESAFRTGYGHNRFSAAPSDWMCTICGCVNFARRTSCFQCNESRSDDAPSADMATSNPASVGKRASDAGPTHVLVVRGLDENADEEMLRYEFAKHAPIKDIRLVRDKFTHVSRGFAFVHFHSVEDATKALDATNGTTLEKNGQIVRVAFAKSVHGPGAGAPQSSSLAAAAIEAATFAQQYDAVGWAPKEYNPDEKVSAVGSEQNGNGQAQKGCSAPQSGFVWDEKSGYYYDAASGFYYDGNSGLYYDGNNGIWYTYDHQNQQYVPCADQSNNKETAESINESKASDGAGSKKVVISAPATTTAKSNEKASLPDAVQAAAAAAAAAEKKEKEKLKEIKLASKSSLLANKKKMNNVLAMWKQRNHEGQAARVVLDDNQSSGLSEDKQISSFNIGKSKVKSDAFSSKDNANSSIFSASAVNRGSTNMSSNSVGAHSDSPITPRPVSNSAGGTIMGVIRGSGKGVIKSDTTFPGLSSAGSTAASTPITSISGMSSVETSVVTPFKTDASALGSYVPPVSASGKRRFLEAPAQSTTPTTYRDRAAERRSLYGSSSTAVRDDMSDRGESNCEYAYRKGSDSMPFPPGVGGGRPTGDVNAQNFEVITADRAIDESNVGNRMLRNMGWQEGLGLGKDGSGIKEPVLANVADDRAGLGSRQRKVVDPSLEAQAGDSYKTIIQKKAIARFREMA
ncbi:SUPPRESSOR OF ABI3-5 isoform X2 [Asparagus officinalis]|uniref:SUPPRESSOR OF ABI3-5 isoform X2 n=1 Tax=Asparagus officinalis TaxID=4686 RepID=UPI00098E18B6|nr:SUPPRESSOR OF ABI3-5 isoform X2 [Asparagus officinalis]